MGERARSVSLAAGYVQPVRILKEGTVTVKVLFFARPRHLTLTSAELLVFESKGEDAKQKFDLVHTTVKADKDSSVFLVEGGSEKMSFRCSSPDERTAWVRAISDAIDQAKAAYQQQVFHQIQQLQGGQGGRGIPPTPLPPQPNYPPTAYPTQPASPSAGRHPLSSSGGSRRPARQVPLSNPPTAVPTTVATRQAPPVSQPQPYPHSHPHPHPQPQAQPQPQPHQLQTSHSQPQTTTQPPPTQPQPHYPQPQQPAYPTLATSLSSTTSSIPSNSLSTAATSTTPHPQVQPLINTNPHGAVFPESGSFPSTPSGTPAMSQTAIFDASVLALMPEVRELFQPVQRWQPPVPETMKLRVDRDPNLQSYLEKYRETYPDLFADPTFIFPDQENVCQPATNRTPGGAHGGGTTTSEILSAAAAGYPGAYQAASPSRPIGLGARRRTTTNVTNSYYYPQYPQQPTARPPSTYVSYSRY